MVWQDIVITICSILFSYSLIPQVYYGFQNKVGTITLQTSGITLLGLILMILTYFSLKLYISALITVIMFTLWTVLLAQTLKYGHISKSKTNKKP